MGLSESLGNLYMKVEDAYYGVLDFFEEKGIGIPWSYNDFLESKGIPALPFTLALIFLLIGSLFFVSAATQAQSMEFTLSLKDDKGRSLEDVNVKIFDEQGNLLKELTASDGQTIKLDGIAPGSLLTVTASKAGYGERSATLSVGDTGLKLSLQGDNDAIVGKLKLVDSETQTTITDAIVTAQWQGGDEVISANPGADGIVLLNVPLNQEITISAKSTNYEDLHDSITFTSGDVKIKEMVPKAGAASGPSIILVKAIDAQTQLPISNVHITIENAQTNDVITDVDSSTGTHSETLQKGTSIRVTVKKDGYLTYSSSETFPGGKTLRNDEETIIAPMQNGGTNLTILTQNVQSQQPVDSVDVDLLDATYETLDRQTSNFSGEAAFGGLNQVNTYYVLGFHPNFLPIRTQVDWSKLQEGGDGKVMNLGLTPFSSSNAGILTVFVNESDGKVAASASVSVDEKDLDTFIPLISKKSTDSAGSFTARLPIGTPIRVRAEKGTQSAEQELTIAGGLNKVVLTLSDSLNAVDFELKFSNGQLFDGDLRVTDTTGGVLFDDPVVDGQATVVPHTLNDTVSLTAKTADGKSYTQTIAIAGRKQISVVLDSVSGTTGSAPEVQYLGLFSAAGEPVPGLSPNQDAFARFQIQWPAGATTGGLFLRVGSDAVANVDSQYVGIIGVNGDAQTISYGRTWTPSPKPGNEAKDRKSAGKAGSLSKWIEVVKKNPSGTSTIDVRLRARSGTPAGAQEIHYRAFTETNQLFARAPADAELGSAAYTKDKLGLYATTTNSSIPVYDSQPICQNGICVNVSFVDEESRFYPLTNFQAVQGKPYALHVQVLPSLTVGSDPTQTIKEGLVSNAIVSAVKTGTTIKAQTDAAEPLLVFTKSEVNVFGKLSDAGTKDTSISVILPAIDPQFGSAARLHFLAQDMGGTTISLQVVSNNGQWSETIPVEIVEARLLHVVMPDKVNPNEPFSISIADADGNPITDALITLTTPDGALAASIKGKNIAGKGQNGQYKIDKALTPGLYNVKVKVPGYVDFEDTLNVGISNPLSFEDKIEVAIPFGQTQVVQNLVLTNTTNYPISNVTAEFKPYDTFPSEIQLEFTPVPAIEARAKSAMVITARFTGDVADNSILSGGGQLTVRGEINAKLPVSKDAVLSATYNKQLDPSCLTFDKTRVAVTLMGENQGYGNMYNGSQYNSAANYYGTAAAPNQYSYDQSGYNPYGVDTYGQYQNAENKRVTIKATNKCGTELLLIPGVSTVDGQLEVDGLKVAAVDSQLRLGNGEQKQVDFTLSNSLFRAGYTPGFLNYALTFRAPQLTASIPLDVQFWDRSRALQTPLSVELNLIKTGNKAATDRAVVPITNIGASPVYDIRATLEGTEPTNVNLKLENGHPYSQTVNSVNSSYSGGNYQGGYFDSSTALQPGQTLYPPIAIVGESTTDVEGLTTEQLQITGRVGSQRILLKTVDVHIRTGSSSCLEVRAFDTPVSFVSSEIAGTLSKRVTISNKCLEPVRVTQVNPATFNGNALSINPVEGTDTLDKDEEAEFNLVLTKANAIKSNAAITVKGVLILSQKGVESNPISLEIALGENELQRANVTNPISVPICEGGTMDVRFPLLAQKNECSQAYCDAEQASNMLSNLIEQQVAKAVQQVQTKKNDATQFKNCDLTKRYCTFSQLGIKSSTIDLYLQNDVITPKILEYVMRDGTYPRLSSMQVEYLTGLVGETADDAFAQRLGTGLGNKVSIPEIQGCGRYQISILGAVEMIGNQLQPDSINMAVKLVTSRQKTAECQDKIYNAANFLPKDRSLTALNSQQTLLGLVEYEKNLETPAQVLAETVFGSKDRAIQNTGSNRMSLQQGVLSAAIVELTLDPVTQGDGPKRIITTIQEVGGQIPKEAAVEAGKIITAIGSSAKTINGCITKDEQTWRISSVPNVGKFTYEGCALPGTKEGGLIIRPNLSCCTLQTKSPVASDVSYSLDPNGTNPLQGVVGLDLYEKKTVGVNTKIDQPGAKISYGSNYPLVFDTKSQTFQKDVLLCATADPQTQQLAHKAQIQSSAVRNLDGVKAGPLTFELRACTLDADDALAKAYGKGNGVWYATVDWDDPVSSKTMKQVVEEVVNGKKTPDAFFAYQDQGILASENPVYKEKFQSKQNAAIVSYGTSCLMSCGLCELGTGAVITVATGGLGTAAVGSSFLWDCLVGCGIGTGVGLYEVNKDKATDTVLESPRNIVEGTYGVARDAVTNTTGVSSENEPAASAALASMTYEAARGTKNTLPELNKINKAAAKPIAAANEAKAAQAALEKQAAAAALEAKNLADAKAAVEVVDTQLKATIVEKEALYQQWVEVQKTNPAQAASVQKALDQAVKDEVLLNQQVGALRTKLTTATTQADAAQKSLFEAVNNRAELFTQSQAAGENLAELTAPKSQLSAEAASRLYPADGIVFPPTTEIAERSGAKLDSLVQQWRNELVKLDKTNPHSVDLFKQAQANGVTAFTDNFDRLELALDAEKQTIDSALAAGTQIAGKEDAALRLLSQELDGEIALVKTTRAKAIQAIQSGRDFTAVGINDELVRMHDVGSNVDTINELAQNRIGTLEGVRLTDADQLYESLKGQYTTVAAEESQAGLALKNASNDMTKWSNKLQTTQSNLDHWTQRVTELKQQGSGLSLELQQAEQNVQKLTAELAQVRNSSTLATDALSKATAELAEATAKKEALVKPLAAATTKANETRAAAKAATAGKLKTVAKGVARGLVCGGIGNYFGYKSYQKEFGTEIENKVTLGAESSNVIDSSTSSLIFQKGQTYKFVVGPGTGTGNSHKVSIDIISPTTQVDPVSWLDDCSQK